MKTLRHTLIVSLAATVLGCQPGDATTETAPPATPVAALAESDWLTDYPAALAKAKAENKLVFMDFTGSDWCSACKTIKKKVLTSSEFAAFARESLVLLEVDFPMQKKQSDAQKKANEALSDKFKIEGYPTLVVVNAEGKQLWREEGYAGESPKEYVAKLKKIPR